MTSPHDIIKRLEAAKGESLMRDAYMNGHGIRDRTRELNDAAWDAIPLAWLGVSAGLLMAVGGLFWRLVVYPPRLVIRYGDGREVWSFGDRLYRDGEPAMSLSADLLCILLVLLGVVIAVACDRPWRKAIRAIRQHREAMEAETKKHEKGWAQS